MLFLACDHGGFKLKEKLALHLKELGVEFVDLGTDSEESVDFPVFCKKLVNEVKKDEQNKGVLVCGSGIGMSICANRNPEIRAALCHNLETARLSREHNDANVLVLGGRTTRTCQAKKMLEIFLTTSFLGGKYKRRMDDCIKLD